MGEQTSVRGTPLGLTRWQLRMVLTVLLSGQLLSALDQTIVGNSLPTIVGQLGGFESFSLVITSYLLTSTVATTLYGKFADIFGAKPVYLIAIAIFTLGSALVGLSQDMTQLVIFRAAQGIGAGGLVVMAFTIGATVVPPRDVGRVQGLVGMMYALASLVGPLVGGAFTQYVSWRWCFFINIPIGLAGLIAVATILKLPKTRREHTIDYLGGFLLTAGVAGILLVATLGGTSYPWRSPAILGLTAACLLLVVLFVTQERRAREPIVPLSLFRSRDISMTMSVTFVVGMGTIGAYYFLPIYLQIVRGYGPTAAGLQLLPLMIAVMVGAGVSGWIMSVVLHRVKAFVITGGALMAVSLFMLSRLDATSALWVVWSAEVVMGLGMGMVISKLIMAAQNVVDRREIGTITGQAATFRIIGSTLGVALLGAVLTARLGVAQRELPQADLDTLPQGADVLYQDPAAIKDLATSLPALHEQVVTAYAQSLQTVFLVALPIMLVAFTLSWFLPNTKLRGEEDYAKAGDGSPGSHDAPRPDGWDGPPGARLTEGLARSDEPRSDAT